MKLISSEINFLEKGLALEYPFFSLFQSNTIPLYSYLCHVLNTLINL